MRYLLLISLLLTSTSFAAQNKEQQISECVNSRMDRVCGEFGSIQCLQTLQNICADMANGVISPGQLEDKLEKLRLSNLKIKQPQKKSAILNQ